MMAGMTGPWDKGLKRLIHAAPQDFDTLVLPGAVLEEELPTEFVSKATRWAVLQHLLLLLALAQSTEEAAHILNSGTSASSCPMHRT